jgi:uncharacterized paraquat-inducible protein A
LEKTKNTIIDFECPYCHARVRADRDKRGKKGFCPRCNYIIRIPRD